MTPQRQEDLAFLLILLGTLALATAIIWRICADLDHHALADVMRYVG